MSSLPPSSPKALISHPKALQRIRWVSYLLDDSIPLLNTGYRMGLDPILGLLPGVGDSLSLLISIYLVMESLRFKLPKRILVRMVANLILDTAVGSVPVAGNIFDVAWKANRKNLRLLEAHIADPKPPTLSDRLVTFGIVGFLLALLLGIVALLATFIWLVLQLLGVN
ncbi:MAG: DUF4112 domain-containing protein [Leptolyngbya sp. DLM2.Bin15]|nr:MAG: DUF4112 domain-containing protein [Leptolyngbya sp. DLM2.Bin15]